MHQTKLNRAYKYLFSTPKLGICLEIDGRDNNYPPSSLFINTYTDASHSVHGDYRSHTRTVIKIGKATIDAKSSKPNQLVPVKLNVTTVGRILIY